MKEDAPILHPRLAITSKAGFGPGGLRPEGDNGLASNVAKHFELSLGDTEKGFKEADVVVERDFNSRFGPPGLCRAPCDHGPLERRRERYHLVQLPGTFLV